MEHRQLIDDVGRFFTVNYNLEKYLWQELEAMRLIALLKTTYSMLNASNKLQDDGSFYMSFNKISALTGLTRRKFERARKVLIQKNLIEVVVKPSSEYSVQFFKINVDLYNTIIMGGESITYKDIESDEEEEGYIEEGEGSKEANNPEESNLKLIPIPEKKTDVVKCDNVLNRWNEIAKKHNLSCIKMLTNARKKKYKSLISSLKISEDEFFNCVDDALSQSSFLRGEKKDWKADFDFFTNKGKVVKAFEGSYKDNDFVSDSLRLSCREQEMLRKRQTLDNLFKDEEEEKLKLN